MRRAGERKSGAFASLVAVYKLWTITTRRSNRHAGFRHAVHVYDPPTPSAAPWVHVPWGKVLAVLAMIFVVAMFAYAIFSL